MNFEPWTPSLNASAPVARPSPGCSLKRAFGESTGSGLSPSRTSMAKRQPRQQVAVDGRGDAAVGRRPVRRPGELEAADALYELPPTYARRPGTFEAADEGEEVVEPCGCISRVVTGRWRLVHVCGKP